MKTYAGVRTRMGRLGASTTVLITEGGKRSLLPQRLDLRDHSPTGFEWGYKGSGPAQLALALLADAVGDAEAEEWYGEFKEEVIVRLPREWAMTEERIQYWYAKKLKEESQLNPAKMAD